MGFKQNVSVLMKSAPYFILRQLTTSVTVSCFLKNLYFFHGAKAPSGPKPPHYRRFTITLRHTTLGRTLLDDWSARRRDLYLATHNTHKRQTSMPPAAFEPATAASERPQTHALHRAATGIGLEKSYWFNYWCSCKIRIWDASESYAPKLFLHSKFQCKPKVPNFVKIQWVLLEMKRLDWETRPPDCTFAVLRKDEQRIECRFFSVACYVYSCWK
jgi:hypothetical protein